MSCDPPATNQDSDPVSRATATEETEWLQRVVRTLPLPDQTLLELHFGYGLSYDRISTVLQRLLPQSDLNPVDPNLTPDLKLTGLSDDDAAALRRISTGGLRVRVSRAIHRLRVALAQPSPALAGGPDRHLR